MPKATNLEDYPKTRAEAGRWGAQFFYPGAICPEGHDGLWYKSTNRCVACAKASARRSIYKKKARPSHPKPTGLFLGANWQVIARP
jgi:hypothetical protein